MIGIAVTFGLGVIVGGLLISRETIAYCRDCEETHPIQTNHCPDCGTRTVKRDIRSLYKIFPWHNPFLEMPQMEEPKTDDYLTEGTGYLYEDSNSNSPYEKRLHLHRTDVSEEEYIENLGASEQGLDIDDNGDSR